MLIVICFDLFLKNFDLRLNFKIIIFVALPTLEHRYYYLALKSPDCQPDLQVNPSLQLY